MEMVTLNLKLRLLLPVWNRLNSMEMAYTYIAIANTKSRFEIDLIVWKW